MGHEVIHSPTSQTNATAVLDVGCGTGYVTDTLGKRFPKATAYGLDLSPVPDVTRQRPSNVRFIQGNILERGDDPSSPLQTSLPEAHFDLIFSRLLIMGLTNWDKYISTAYSLLKAGGWLELHEIDWIFYSHDPTQPTTNRIISNSWPWFRLKRSAMAERGLDAWCGSRAAVRMTEAGFDEIFVKEYYWSFGAEGEEKPEMRAFGEYVVENMRKVNVQILERLEGEGRVGGDEVSEMRGRMLEDLGPEKGKRWKFYVTCGRKPMEPLV